LVDDTPILDLKPYLASADRPQKFSSGWADTAQSLDRDCEFTPKADEDLESLFRAGMVEEPTRVRALIHEMLTHDPRPPAYLAREPGHFAVWSRDSMFASSSPMKEFIVTDMEPMEGTQQV